MLRLAILDMNDGHPNQGMRCLQKIAGDFADRLETELFDVRAKGQVPDLNFDIYISSGGPGSPLASQEQWEIDYFHLLDQLWAHNRQSADPSQRKHVFFICHSFQMACRYFSAGRISARRTMSFGTFPVHTTNEGERDWLFDGLDETFFVADFREYQVVQPNHSSLGSIGASVLAYEKVRAHVPYERAVMAIRFSSEWVGTQFHPEADADGMILHFSDPKRKEVIIDEYGADKYASMMAHLHDPDKIERTNTVVIPNFIRHAIQMLESKEVLQHS